METALLHCVYPCIAACAFIRRQQWMHFVYGRQLSICPRSTSSEITRWVSWLFYTIKVGLPLAQQFIVILLIRVSTLSCDEVTPRTQLPSGVWALSFLLPSYFIGYQAPTLPYLTLALEPRPSCSLAFRFLLS